MNKYRIREDIRYDGSKTYQVEESRPRGVGLGSAWFRISAVCNDLETAKTILRIKKEQDIVKTNYIEVPE